MERVLGNEEFGRRDCIEIDIPRGHRPPFLSHSTNLIADTCAVDVRDKDE
jgi:hypothetical protein